MAIDSASCYFQLSLSNSAIEEASESDVSTASHMQLVLEQEELDLNQHIYMKSLAAEISMENFSLSNLPSTFCGRESIGLNLTTSTELGQGNAVANGSFLESRNVIEHLLPLPALITSSPVTAIKHINKQISYGTNKYILLRYIEMICDTDFFKKSSFEGPQLLHFNEDELSLMTWYLRAAMITRYLLVTIINLKLNVIEKLPILKPRPTSVFTETKEHSVVLKSSVFQSIDNRKTVVTRLVNFSRFHDKKISDFTESDNLETTSTTLAELTTDLNAFLVKMGYLTTVEGKLTAESVDTLNTVKDNNIILLDQAEICYNILQLERQKHNSPNNQGLRQFYHNEILELSLDNIGKCAFDLYPNLFMASDKSTFTFRFGPLASRVLGVMKSACDDELLVIGPFSRTLAIHNDRTKLKRNIILSSNDRLFSRVCPMPTALFILTDMISNDCHYASSWLTSSQFSAYQILAAYNITVDDVNSSSIIRLTQPRRFFRVKQAQNVLRSVNLVIVDQHFRELSFVPKTYCHFSLCLRPANLNI